MRTITLIVVHCTANKAGSTLRVKDIDRYHRSLGWKGCGYHYVIPTDGTIEKGRAEDLVGAHCKNHNKHSIGVAYVGGLDGMGRLPRIPGRLNRRLHCGNSSRNWRNGTLKLSSWDTVTWIHGSRSALGLRSTEHTLNNPRSTLWIIHGSHGGHWFFPRRTI